MKGNYSVHTVAGTASLGSNLPPVYDAATHTFSELFHNCVYIAIVAIFFAAAYRHNKKLERKIKEIALEKKQILDCAFENLNKATPEGGELLGHDQDDDTELLPLEPSDEKLKKLVFEATVIKLLLPGAIPGISTDAKTILNTLNADVTEKQRVTTITIAVLHFMVLVCSAVWMWAVVFGSKFWHVAMQAVVHLVFWGASFAVHIRSYINHFPTPGFLQATWIVLVVVGSVMVYDIERNGYPDLPSLLQIAAYWGSYGSAGFVAILGAYQIYLERSSALFDTHVDLTLLASFRARVVDWVNSGRYMSDWWAEAEPSEDMPTLFAELDVGAMSSSDPRDAFHPKKHFESMTISQRTRASEAFGNALSKRMRMAFLASMGTKGEGLLLVCGSVGAVAAAVGFAVLPVVGGTIFGIIGQGCYNGSQDAMERLEKECINLVIPMVLIVIGKLCASIFTKIAGSRVVNRVQRILFVAYTHQEHSYFEDKDIVELVKLVKSADKLRDGLSASVVDLIGGIIQILLCVILMLNGSSGSTSPVLFGIVAGFSVPAMIGAAMLIWEGTVLASKHEDSLEIVENTMERVLSDFTNKTPIEDSNAAEAEYSIPAKSSLDFAVKRDLWRSAGISLMFVSWIGAQASVYKFGGEDALHGNIDFRYFASFAGLQLHACFGIAQIHGALPGLAIAVQASKAILSVLVRHPALVPKIDQFSEGSDTDDERSEVYE